MSSAFPRSEVEDFLYREARLLDNWQLEEWAALFTEDGSYLVPSTDAPDGDPSTTLFLIYDDRHRLDQRAKRLLQKGAHAEYPHSRTRHLVSNVIVEPISELEARVECNFVVYRSKGEIKDVYPGHSIYHLLKQGGDFRIQSKRAVLDLDTLRPQGKVSIIL
ncbi:MAG: aromatic-ring-hydroxylating dioxygenase subunit beta [Aquisalimonadaceae bacterium]